MFDGVPMSVCLVSKSEAVSVACSFQSGSEIDEKHGVVDILFLGEFRANDRGITLFRVENSLKWRKSFVSGSTTAYSQSR